MTRLRPATEQPGCGAAAARLVSLGAAARRSSSPSRWRRLALRLARLDVRPMHNDEANQAIKFGALLETRRATPTTPSIITARRSTT